MRLALILLMFLTFDVPTASACYWDRDTLQMERQRFPSVLDLLTGHFVRHSDAFYRWRISDRTQRLAQEGHRTEWVDDLAVARDQLGEHAEAIALMETLAEREPERYETQANLGTFRIHAGEWAAGLIHIQKAIAINPDAHFGREIIQQRLVEYALRRRAAGHRGLPLADGSCEPAIDRVIAKMADYERQTPPPSDEWMCAGFNGTYGFATAVREANPPIELAAAIRGVAGMMRFSNHESPVLLEALGDLLLGNRNRQQDAKQLAARAYLKASYVSQEPASAQRYRAKAILALVGHRRPNLLRLERRFRRESARGVRWFERISRRERRWIEAGRDVDAAFERAYYRRGAPRR